MRERGLWATLVVLAGGDAATTVVALSLGLPEANPLVRALVATLGVVAVPLSQAVYVGLARLVVGSVEPAYRRYVLLAGVVPSGLVVVNNLAWIALEIVGWSA